MVFLNIFEQASDHAVELVLLILAIFIVVYVIFRQNKAYKETKNLIDQLSDFFPDSSALEIVQSSITKDILSSKSQLVRFIANPPARRAPAPSVSITEGEKDESEDETEFEVDNTEYADVDLIRIKSHVKVSDSFKEAVNETNAYLCKNVGSSADFSLLQDICERKIETLDSQINNTLNTPLYLGLGGTFIGIIAGVLGVAFNAKALFSDSDMFSLVTLLVGVGIAMAASLWGLYRMIRNTSVNYKKAIANSDKNKNNYYDFLRRELMPVLSNSMASSLNSLKGVLGEFIGKFGHNLTAYANSAELLNDNIEKQHLLLVEINRMDQTKVASEIANTFKTLKESSDSLSVFRSYQNELNDTIKDVDGAVDKINEIISSFEDFTKALKVVVENQGASVELQSQFRAAIEKHFPTGSEAREMWRKQFDELTKDASEVSSNLNSQLIASTQYISSFMEDNKEAFKSLTSLNEVLDALTNYANIQATCYKDLKEEIENLKKEQVTTQKENAKLNADLLTAVKEMISAIKTMKG